jgi:16S rRNA (adenine1518-N6/adenine1519-N6)-dimethyltransferase
MNPTDFPARPRKRFGQHFLCDTHILKRIVDAIAPKASDTLIEIGPGEGALTLPLLAAAGRLTAIELDRDLIEPLRRRAANAGELSIIQQDVLTVDFADLAQGAMLRIAGNLPYNISTPILFHCLQYARMIGDMHFMLQKEVVERMAAPPGGKVYGRLSVMLQLRCRVEPLFDVPPGAFRPPPKVDSAVVRLVPLAAREIEHIDFPRVERLVRAAFGQRRKTLANALRGLIDAERLAAAGIDARARAEQLAPTEFAALAGCL